MGSNLTFNEDDSLARARGGKQLQKNTGLIGWMIRKKIAKDRASANLILLVILVLSVVVVYFIWFVGEDEADVVIPIREAAGNNIVPYD